MPRYYFDIKDGHRLVDPSGATFNNDHDAIERAKAVAIVVSIDKPEVDPCVYRKLKRGRSGGEVRQGWRVN
jgi:hypothetical protein